MLIKGPQTDPANALTIYCTVFSVELSAVAFLWFCSTLLGKTGGIIVRCNAVARLKCSGCIDYMILLYLHVGNERTSNVWFKTQFKEIIPKVRCQWTQQWLCATLTPTSIASINSYQQQENKQSDWTKYTFGKMLSRYNKLLYILLSILRRRYHCISPEVIVNYHVGLPSLWSG